MELVFPSAKENIKGYHWSEEKGVYTDDEELIESNLTDAKLGLMEEDEKLYKETTKKLHNKANKIRVTFEEQVRSPDHTGNSNMSQGSVQTFSSGLDINPAPKKKSKTTASTITASSNSASETSGLTGSLSKAGFDKLKNTIVNDSQLYNQFYEYFKTATSLPKEREATP